MAAIGVLVVLLAACTRESETSLSHAATPSTTTTIAAATVPTTTAPAVPELGDALVGVWVTDMVGAHVAFLDDGTYGTGHSLGWATQANVSMADLEWGTWSTNGNILTMTADATSESCEQD